MTNNLVGPPVRGKDCFGREAFVELVWDKLRVEAEAHQYEFACKLLRDWWLRHYALEAGL